MNTTEIIGKYTAGEATLEETNEALKEFGLSLDPSKSGKGWTPEEVTEGFRNGEPGADVQRKPDMARRTDLAGQTVTQHTAAGQYAVTYDADGYAVKAVKQ